MQKEKRGLGKQVARSREEWIEVSIPAIISDDDFRKAQYQMVKNKQQAKRNIQYEYLMSRRLR